MAKIQVLFETCFHSRETPRPAPRLKTSGQAQTQAARLRIAAGLGVLPSPPLLLMAARCPEAAFLRWSLSCKCQKLSVYSNWSEPRFTSVYLKSPILNSKLVFCCCVPSETVLNPCPPYHAASKHHFSSLFQSFLLK